MMKHLQQSVLEGSAGLVSGSSRENGEGGGGAVGENSFFSLLTWNNVKLLLAA